MCEIGQQIKTQTIDGLQVRKPLKNDAVELMCITLEKGAKLPEHSSPKDAFLLVLEGALDFFINGKTFTLGCQEDLSFPRDIPHHVVARENAKFLIIR